MTQNPVWRWVDATIFDLGRKFHATEAFIGPAGSGEGNNQVSGEINVDANQVVTVKAISDNTVRLRAGGVRAAGHLHLERLVG